METLPRHSAPLSHQARLVYRSAILILAALSTLLATSTARADPPSGMLFAWGDNEWYQLGLGEGDYNQPLPVRLDAPNDFVAVSCGTAHTLALRADGTVWVWGPYHAVQLEGTGVYDLYVPTQISGLDGVVSIAAGRSGSVVLKGDGTVWAWGYVMNIWYNDEYNDAADVPAQVAGLSDVKGLAMGDEFALVVRSDGTVWGWGDNRYGQLGPSAEQYQYPPVQIDGLANIVAVSAGDSYALAVSSDGLVWSWGRNIYGLLGDGTTDDRVVPAPIAGLSDIVAVAAGATHCAAVTREGAVWTWGYNSHGELGDGTTKTRLRPAQVADLDGVARVAAGEDHTLALKHDGTLWAWGSNHLGALGADLPPYKFYAPVQVTALAGVLDVSAGAGFTVAIGEFTRHTVSVEAVPPEGGTATITPLKSQYDFGDIVTVEATTSAGWVFRGWEGLPAPVEDPHAATVTFEILDDLHITARFEPFRPVLTVAVVPREGAIVERVPDKPAYDYGETVTVTINPAEGYDFIRWLGLPPEAGLDPTERTISLTLTNHTLVTAGLSGPQSSGSGAVWAWGGRHPGNGTNEYSPTPVRVAGLDNAVAVSTTSDRVLVLRSDGTVWAWGANSLGQLGDGTQTNRNRPVQVTGLTDIVAISAGGFHNLALKADGAVWGWGVAGYGELGDPVPAYHLQPTRIQGFDGIIAVRAGQYFSLALRNDGTVWSCGRNTYGQLGDGTTIDRHRPVQAVGLDHVKAVATSAYKTVALKEDGTVWKWGHLFWDHFILEPLQIPGAINIIALSRYGGQLRGDGAMVGQDNDDLHQRLFENPDHPVTVRVGYRFHDLPRLPPSDDILWTPIMHDGSLWKWQTLYTESGDRYSEMQRVPGMINVWSASSAGSFYVVVGDYVPNTLDIKADIGPAANWVYQNTPRSVDNGGHAVRLEVTVLDDSGNSHFEVSAEKAADSGSGQVFVVDDPADDPLVKYVAGSMRTDGREGTGPLSLAVKVTGLENGHSRIVELPLVVRPLGDLDGNGGAEPQDVMAMIRKLNGNPPPGFEDRAFDLDANGAADMADFQVLMNILNGRPIP